MPSPVQRSRFPFRPSRLALALLAGFALPSLAAAQDASIATRDLDKLTVTGSRIARSQLEGPAPVTVITAQDIQKQGFSTVWESLGTLTQFSGSAFNESDQTGSSPNGQYLNLRGLGPGYQLILLNGKRMADYPQSYNANGTAVSLGSIPAAAVERIEVVSGGASAIYGSDAVAGVVNIITKRDFSGDTLRLRGGTTTRGGGDSGQLQWSGGRSGDRWSLTYAFERLDREAIVASQRDFLDSYDDHPANKADPSSPNASISGVYLRRGNTYLWPSGGALSTSAGALDAACAATNPAFRPYKTADSLAAANRCGAFGYYEGRSVQNGYGKTSAYLSGSFDFSDAVTGYAQLLANRSKDESSSQTHYYIGEGAFTVYDPDLGLVTAQRIFLPSEVGGIKHIAYDEKSWNLNAGVRGKLFDGRFDWDASVSMSRYDISTRRPRFLTNAVRDYYMGPVLGYRPDSTEIRAFYADRLFAPGSAALYDQLTTEVVSRGESSTDQAQFVFSGDLFALPAGMVQIATVLEAARQKYDLAPDPRTTVDYTGSERIYNLTQTPGGGPRDRYAAGLELRVPIFRRLSATLAGRYDKYDDITAVDAAATWQAGLEWRPFDSLLLRGSHATSFRAPDLLWIYAGTSANNPTVTDEYLCRRDGLDPLSAACSSAHEYQTFSTQSSNPLLEEEKGKSTTLGFVWDVLPTLSLSADYYRIELQGRVESISSEALLENNANCLLGRDRAGNAVDTASAACQFYLQSVTRSPGTDLTAEGQITAFETFPINQSLMRTDGVDANLRYNLDLGDWGAFGLQAGYTRVLRMEVAQFVGAKPLDVMNDVDYLTFRTRTNWRANWSVGDWSTSLYGYRYGSRPNYAERARVAPYVIWNADIAKRITDKATLGISVLNVFDKIHPRDDTYTAWPYFPRVYSAIGRQLYANFTYHF
ncbi:TonB-dependent receptor [Xanthomonas translucens pv. undulosa]|uniref:TonB-dependent receptor plug domain-containing protein n=1 Tax=Xanthomonas campestris pv. translucens TaxID=343 RepID=UPI00065659EE|nr:TonB-dependent receptor [Xanthomonas translucens]AKK66373.1 TonB-dependent receptor [Xanthomonas translucens pv. undulosa]MCT8270192.1 TonB-dependent receptor [Xanthomonas translucens pv. undulosa]QSQ41738.1 TonB-dependent receptor [Xanthomonas translucens pv. translucens]QSQ50417.1 TonB-dependent receptor [Xanthomonas translucens pv. undulosa]UJB15552.1 TonB-dependent receptor [Xanthomonas translucens pv. undulosa]